MSALNDVIQILYNIASSASDIIKMAFGDPSGPSLEPTEGLVIPQGSAIEDGSTFRVLIDGLTQWRAANRKVVSSLQLHTLNDEENVDIGEDGGGWMVPRRAVFRVTSASGTPAGDAEVKIGTSSGGSQILGSTALAGLATVGQTFSVDLSGLSGAAGDDSTIYAKVTSADSGLGANVICDVYFIFELVG